MKASISPLHFQIRKIVGAPFSDEAIDLVVKEFQPRALRKGELLANEGAICNSFCFIESGILQHFILLDGDEKTTYLSLRNSFTSSLKSFRYGEPSRKYIKALTSTNIWELDSRTFHQLLKESNCFEVFYHALIEHQIYRIDDYRIDLLMLTPEERYSKLLESEPTLLQMVPLKVLASFLGISLRHLSRVRKG